MEKQFEIEGDRLKVTEPVQPNVYHFSLDSLIQDREQLLNQVAEIDSLISECKKLGLKTSAEKSAESEKA